jgi:FlaA1/EpsC-like NDP-sugar epimerase
LVNVPSFSFSWRRNIHRGVQILVDGVLVALAWWLAFSFRFDGALPGLSGISGIDGPKLQPQYDRLFRYTLLVVIAIKLLVFIAGRFYTKWWRFTSMRDLQSVVVAVLIGSLLVTTVLALWHPVHRGPREVVVGLPRGVLVLDFFITLTLVGGARFLVRSLVERPGRSDLVARRGREVLICGAGDAGNTLLRDIQRNRALGYNPVGLIDDDPRKAGLRVQGVRVLGARQDLKAILKETKIDEVLIAMPSAPGSVRREITDACRAAGVKCRTLPSLNELIAGEVTVRMLRDVSVEDLLGRAPVRIEFERVSRYLNGKTVLVTGAGGSIGSELCRQVLRAGPAALIMIDHAENNLFEIDRQVSGRGRTIPIIADCRDHDLMERILVEHRPSIVFHAAAYKHVPMMELNPLQAVDNNALATASLTELASIHGVERFCLISTDKAVEPKTIMGATKALGERIVESRDRRSATRFAAVRFGNVLGSSGSVVPIFRQQIAAGGPVTVTDAEMTRYFMTIPEAVQLVIEATGIAEGGDIFVLDMGDPVRIMDLAENMIRLSGREPGRDIAIEVVGIRPGEKLHEELFNLDEHVQTTRYGRILRATRPALDPVAIRVGLDLLRERVDAGDRSGAADVLWRTLSVRRDAADEPEPQNTMFETKEDTA